MKRIKCYRLVSQEENRGGQFDLPPPDVRVNRVKRRFFFLNLHLFLVYCFRLLHLISIGFGKTLLFKILFWILYKFFFV